MSDNGVENVDPTKLLLAVADAAAQRDPEDALVVFEEQTGVDPIAFIYDASWAIVALGLAVALLLLPLILLWLAYLMVRRSLNLALPTPPTMAGPFDAVREYMGDCMEEAAEDCWTDAQWRRAALAIPGIFAYSCVGALISPFRRG